MGLVNSALGTSAISTQPLDQITKVMNDTYAWTRSDPGEEEKFENGRTSHSACHAMCQNSHGIVQASHFEAPGEFGGVPLPSILIPTSLATTTNLNIVVRPSIAETYLTFAIATFSMTAAEEKLEIFE